VAANLLRLLRDLPLLVLSPLLLLLTLLALAAADLLRALFPRRLAPETRPRTGAASIVIPNWNGRDLLEKYLPGVLHAAAGNPANEVIVVDDASTDGSAAFLRQRFPAVKLVALPENRGFGGAANAGFHAAANDIVVLLNSDMRVAPGFLAPLLAGFTDEKVFSVSCQIFFSDPAKMRQETGLTQMWWSGNNLRVRHRQDDEIEDLYPCAYGGGGSSAYDKRKFFELGGFDEILAPFYFEDTDLGYMAWKRGWKVLYQPASHVYHEHRGTIGKSFSDSHIQNVLRRNLLLLTWKNIHEWPRLLAHFVQTGADALLSSLFGPSPERTNVQALGRAFLQLSSLLLSRWRALGLAAISDTEALRRPLGGYYRDRFQPLPPHVDRPEVLFVSPYPIVPPVHGGAVFMNQTVRELARRTGIHLVVLLDYETELEAHQELRSVARSAAFHVRRDARTRALASIEPHAVREFRSQDVEWLIHRQIYTRGIDVVQLDYTVMAQYAADFRQIPCVLFEHDIYFQSIARQLPGMRGWWSRVAARYEYLRALRFELRALPRLDRVQTCSRENAACLASFLPELAGRLDPDLRAGIDTARYEFRAAGREPGTMLFLGSFRHLPNQEGLRWLYAHVLPRIHAAAPASRLLLVGSEPPPPHALPHTEANVELVGFVGDVREPLSRCAVFLCPILSGSGVRVKLLEAFAAGIPVVSTRLGAEGLAERDGEICALADTPEEFAAAVLRLLADPAEAKRMAVRAREYVVRERDIAAMTARLVESYAQAVAAKRRR
jgi:GT2 family glycosyltransferase/glycosyltransferase involved in cell wall biosynthesis